MSIRQFEPSRAVEIFVHNKYGSGYRIGGRLVLTAAHFLGDEGSDCKVRDKKRSFGNQKARVVYRRESGGIDIALLELPEEIEAMEAIALGKLPDATAGEKLAFQMYGYPRWAWTQGEHGSAAGGRQIDGIIYPSDYSPDEWLVLEAERLPPEATTTKLEWVGASGAAIVCDGLVIAVQRQHQNPDRPASLEASHLWKVNDDERWRQLLETHGISPELEIARLSIADQPLEIAWHDVSAQLLEARRQLTTNLMTRRGDIAYEVEQVFVPLGLVERKKVPRRRENVFPEQGSELYQEGKGRRPGLPREANSDQEESTQKEEEEITQTFEHQQFLEQVLDQGQSPKSQGKRIAIIGEPGAGKTTLLQQIGRWVLATFPESMVIWVSLADLGKKNLKQYVYETWLTSIAEQYGRSEVSVQIKDAFIARCNQGQVWLLLDGLDEMQGDGNPLSTIQRQIGEGGWLQQVRMLLTCRVNLWDGHRNALDTFDVYRTLEFSYPEQVEQFIIRWFRPQNRDDLGQTLCTALQAPSKARIRDLVKNPLRLTLLCFDWGLTEGRLPETQAELYQRFVERIYEWKAEEFPTTEQQRQELNGALALLSLAAIDDQDEQGNARFRLRHKFVQEFLKSPIFDLALQLGWLNQVGVNADDPTRAVYAFHHPTFEEYFAALAIDDWDFFLPRNHRNKPVKGKPYRIFEPQWKQVLLLWLGREGGELGQEQDLTPQKEALIRALTTFKDGCRSFYSDRAFLLAVAGIAEFKNCIRADAIVDRLMKWRFGSSNWSTKGWAKRFDSDSARVKARRDLATSAIGITNLQRAIRALVRLLESTPDEDTRRSAATSLGQIGTGNETAIRALVQLLESTLDEDIRWSAATSLGRIDPGNKRAIRALVRLIEPPQDEDTRQSAAKSLGQIGTGNEMAIRALARQLESNSVRLCWSAATSLSQIGTGNEMAVQALVQLLDSTHPKLLTRWRAAHSLNQIDPGNKRAIRDLVRLLESNHSLVYDDAAKSLGQIGTGNETVIRELLSLLDSTLDENTCQRAATSLGQIDPGNKRAIQDLVRLLDSTRDWVTRMRAAKSLGKIGTGNETAIRALVRLLESTQDDYTRWRAAKSLGKIDPGNETAIRALMRLLKSTQDDDIRMRAAKSLGKIDPGNEMAIRALVRLLKFTQDDDTRRRIAESLGLIGTDNEAIRVLVRLRSKETYQLMMKCAEARPYPEFYQVFHASRWPF